MEDYTLTNISSALNKIVKDIQSISYDLSYLASTYEQIDYNEITKQTGQVLDALQQLQSTVQTLIQLPDEEIKE